VSENQLTDLPDSIKALLRLETFNVSFNRLSQLPDAAAELPDLCNVDVSWNILTVLPVSWGNKSSCDELDVYVASLGCFASPLAAFQHSQSVRSLQANRKQSHRKAAGEHGGSELQHSVSSGRHSLRECPCVRFAVTSVCAFPQRRLKQLPFGTDRKEHASLGVGERKFAWLRHVRLCGTPTRHTV
jgi:hypothetical protein